MNFFTSDAPIRTHLLAVEPGEFVIESLTAMIEEKGIKNGAVISGIGTLDKCKLHMVTPDGNVYPEWDESTPLELVSMQGVIADGFPHIHTTVSTDKAAISGHMHEGCRALYLAEVVVLEFTGFDLTRAPGASGIDTLCEKRAR
jgi:predicted DNA-binding protein with PD1-like motif